ncbi:MAG: anthranilate phosphoribosyltransferase [Gemmatimonadales bacterium]|nr:MAG: anthranilate phosphoribosyltransferase [Gemmatimonadales bacterium]
MSQLVARVTEGHDLEEAEAEFAFDRIMAGEASPVQMAALLAALRTKGHAPSEVAGGVRALRTAMVPVPVGSLDRPLVDTCGTGGGSVTTFNISTAAALVAAASGVRVAKHGNRSFTSRSGSADVLKAMGVRIDLTPDAMARTLGRAGIVFMFAPLLHPAMRHVGPVRRELGIPTIMNLLGPLTNPAGVRRQVVGVSDPTLAGLVAEALHALGHQRALVVHGEPGMDEVSPMGETRVMDVTPAGIRSSRISPEELGLEPASPAEIAGGEPEENAEVILRVLRGEDRRGARTVTLLNAAAALLVGDVAKDWADGVSRAAEAVDSGAALETLETLRTASREEGAR